MADLQARRAELQAQKAAAGLALSEAERDVLHVATFDRPRLERDRDPFAEARAVAIARTVTPPRPPRPAPPTIDYGLFAPAAAPVDQDPDTPTIRIHPSIIETAARHDHGAQLRIWLTLRHMGGARGLHVFTFDQLRDRLPEITGLSWRRIRQILTAGAGRWWSMHGRGYDLRVAFFAPERVQNAYQAGYMRGEYVGMPAAVLGASHGEFMAHCQAAWLTGRVKPLERNGRTFDRPISQAVIGGALQVHRSTLTRRAKRARISATRNATAGVRYSKEALQEMTWNYERVFMTRQNGHVMIHATLPNSYQTRLTPDGRGRRTKQNARIRPVSMWEKAGPGDQAGDPSRVNDDRARFERRYFPTAAAANRALSAGARVVCMPTGQAIGIVSDGRSRAVYLWERAANC